MSSAGASGGGGGGAAYWGSWAYCCWSSAAQRPAWRRETRLDTAVAVPATTAVRATPRRSPGMAVPLSSSDCAVGGLGRLQGCEQRLNGDTATGHQLSTATPQSAGEGAGPD